MIEVRKTPKLFINGAFVRSESGRTFVVGDNNVPLASRKDLRDAIRYARGAQKGWADRTAYNRGQILYRAAEMLQSRTAEFAALVGKQEVQKTIEALVWYAGWADKLEQVAGRVNPVNGPYFNFTYPEPMGVVGLVVKGGLRAAIEQLAPILVGGNTAVVLLDEQPVASLALGEVLATSDFPPGVINLLSGESDELLPHLAKHYDINAIVVSEGARKKLAEELGSDSVKRISSSPRKRTPDAILACMERKTVWHPIGV